MAIDGEAALKFHMIRGQSFQMRFTAYVEGTDPTELTNRLDLSVAGTKVSWRCKLDAANADAATLISKSNNVATEILVLPQGVGDATRGQYDVFLIPGDTNTSPTVLAPGTYVFDTWVERAGPPVLQHPVKDGILYIRRSISDLVATPIPP